MLPVKPRWYRVSRRAQDDLDPRLVHAVENALHPVELKLAVARLPTAPCGFPHPDHGDAGLLHQLDVFVQPIVLSLDGSSVVRRACTSGSMLVGQ